MMTLVSQTPITIASSSNQPIRAWLALFVVLAACLPALLVGVAQRLSTHTMENVALVTSQETWLRLHDGDSEAWLVSTNDGKPRLEKPPLLTWLNVLAWSDLDPGTATPQQLTHRARLVSAAMGLLMLVSTYWMGVTLAGARFGALAALMVGSTLFFQRQARTASYDIHFVAWETLAVAAGLWAMRPFGATPSMDRRLLGWTICGVGLCAAAMSKNPLPYFFVVPALIAAIVLTSPSRRNDSIWLAATVVLSFVPVAAWYGSVFTHYQEVAQSALGREVVQPRAGDFQPVYYYLGLLGLTVPWTLWLVGGVIEPFKMDQGSPARGAAMFALFWFAFIFIVLTIPPAKQQRYILAIMPATGLLIAAFFRHHEERVARREPDRMFEIIFAGLWAALGVFSIIAPAFLVAPDRIIGWWDNTGGIDQTMAALPWPLATVLLVTLLICVRLGWRWHARKPWRSAISLGGWMLALMTAFWRQEAIIPSPRVQPFVVEAARISAIVGNAPLWSLRWVNLTDNGYEWKINEEFRFYLGRRIPRIPREELAAWVDLQREKTFVMVRPDASAAQALRDEGLVLIDAAKVDRDDRHELWLLTP